MNTKQKIGRACMIVGILLILGALALLGYNQWDANRADKASQDALGKLEETLTETMEDKTKDEEPVVQPELDPEQEMTVTDIDGWGYIGYLSIPSIGLELPVMSEWSYAGLKVAPGRYSGSTYADNMVVCAHNYAKHFSPIKWLALGSEVYFTDMDGQRWSYEVSNVETIQPTDIDKMITASDEDAWDLTLFTCTTGGRARCAVRCTRTAYPVLETSAAGLRPRRICFFTGRVVTRSGIGCCWPAAKAQKENSRFAERNPVTSLPVRCHSGIRCHSPP